MAQNFLSCFLLLVIQIYGGFAIINDDRAYLDKILTELNVTPAKEKAQQWLLSQRNSEWGWGSDSDTANAIMALQLSQSNWSSDKREYELSSKQLALHYALDMAGSCCQDGSSNVLTTGRVAQYIDAFLSLCKDPHNFYGHDLVLKLQDMNPRYQFEVGYRALALCNAGYEVSVEVVEQIKEILKNDHASISDTKAINLMALTCINKQGKVEDEQLKSFADQLATTQNEDGSFGNIWSSAIVVQSLLPFSDEDYSWNATSALQNILNSQNPEDGSFTNQLGAFFALPILNGKNLGDFDKVACPAIELQTALPVTTSPLPDITVTYSIWKGNPVDESYAITLQVQNLTSVYSLMNTAQNDDERFKFTAQSSSSGHFITSIGGLQQDESTKSYWLFGTLENPEDKDIKYADTSVDDFLLTKDGEHIVFWYKQLDF